MRSVYAQRLVGETRRDTSFARVGPTNKFSYGLTPNYIRQLNLVMDEYEDNPGRPAKDKSVFSYGQVQFYAYVTLRVQPNLGMATDITEILAIVSLCRTNWEDTTKGPVWYEERSMGSIRAFSARAIDCAVGRVKVGDRWGIVDRSWGLQDAIMEGMVEPEYESEDDPDM